MKTRFVFISLIVFVAVVLVACSTTVTPVYLLRHAEKGSGFDPNLTLTGEQRAEELVRILKNVPVAAVYSTDTNRARQTAQPLATDRNLSLEFYTDLSVAGTILFEHEKEVVVIVGHSDTVPGLINAFGGTPPYTLIPGSEFDNLFLLIVKKEKRMGSRTLRKVKLLHMKYGARLVAP